jgi:hypothetical protein
MNYQTAAVVGGAAFLLSGLAGLMGGVPLFDLVIRALFWGALGFGASLGVETLLRSLMPDLFTAPPADDAARETDSPRQVDITLDDEPRGGVFEEVDDDEPAFVARRQSAAPPREPGEPAAPEAPAETKAADARAEEPEEEMPEIGAFLDAFKPSSADGEAAAGPELGEYTPVEAPERRSSREVMMDGEEQDPVILAKAIQTVMKRDGQGN